MLALSLHAGKIRERQWVLPDGLGFSPCVYFWSHWREGCEVWPPDPGEIFGGSIGEVGRCEFDAVSEVFLLALKR